MAYGAKQTFYAVCFSLGTLAGVVGSGENECLPVLLHGEQGLVQELQTNTV